MEELDLIATLEQENRQLHARNERLEKELEIASNNGINELRDKLHLPAGIVLQPSAIYERIWGYDFGPDSKNLAVYIGYLRRKLEQTGEPRLIHTVRGVGYSLRTQ